MNHYIHHVPGRLRVRLPSLKDDAERRREIHRSLSRVAGISSVDINPLTGSVLVHYDTNSQTFDRVMRAFERQPCCGATHRAIEHDRAVHSIAAKLAKKFAAYIFQTALERAAFAALAALL